MSDRRDNSLSQEAMDQSTIKGIIWFVIIMGLIAALTSCKPAIKRQHTNRETDTVICVGLRLYTIEDTDLYLNETRDTMKVLTQWGDMQSLTKGDTISLWRMAPSRQPWRFNPTDINYDGHIWPDTLGSDSITEYRYAIVYKIPEDKP